MKQFFLFLITLFFISPIFAQKDWQFQKDTKGIEVYYRDSDDSFIKELKMTTVMDGSLSAVYSVLNDLPLYTTWIYGCDYAELVARPSDYEMHYYAITDFPWPMSDRDYVIKSTMTQDPETRVVSSTSIAVRDARPKKKNMVRLDDMKITWKMTPLKDKKVRIDYYLKSDPGGNIPAWAVNFALDRGPMQSMLRFKKLLKEEKYQTAQLSYIKD